MKKYYAYIRKSTDEKDRQTLSLQAQRRIVEEHAERNGLKIIKWYEESKSAKKPGRELFNKLSECLTRDEADGVIAHKVDRLSRNDFDMAILTGLVKIGKEIIVVEGNFDLGSPSGLLNFRLQSVLATNFVDNLSQEVKKGQKQKLLNGWFPAFAPTGYVNRIDIDGKSKIYQDEKKAPIIKKAFELIAFEGLSTQETAERVSSLGLTSRTGSTITKSQLWKIIKNPFYYGYFRWNNELVEGAHEPIVDQETWKRANNNLADNSNHKSASHYYPYRGALICGECGRKITAETQKGHVYYRCTKSKGSGSCNQPYLRKEELESQFENIFKGFQFDFETSEKIKTDLLESHSQEIQFRESAIRSINSRISELRHKKDRLLDLRIENEISKEEHDAKKVEIDNQIQDLEIELNAYKKTDDNWKKEVEGFFELANNGYKIYKLANDQEKELLVRSISSNLVIKDKRLIPELKLAFHLVSNRTKSFHWFGDRDSNPD